MCFIIAIIINLLVAYIVRKKKRLNMNAVVLAYILGVLVLLKSGFAYIMLGIYFFLIQIIEQKVDKVENRTAIQVFCNGIVAVIALYLKTNSSYVPFEIFIYLLASSLADCVASDIGTTYASKVYSIIGLRKIEKGLSGGVSIIGSFGSFVSVVLFSIFYGFCSYIRFRSFSIRIAGGIIIWGFAGMFLDSILGAALQKKYYCSLYKKICEKEKDCKYMEPISKWKILSNNGVNLITSFFLFFILLLVL